MEKYKKILEQFWGYADFRPLQDEIIRSIGEGRDTLGLMPTGGGKSLTFQVPALAVDGICLVVTPLIALMKDQVDNLRSKGIKAAAIYSGMSRQEILLALDNCILGDYKFLYISPERLSTELFLLKLKQMNVSMIAVDESHCISQWGYDFRPSYLQIADIRDYLPNVPVLALTATATPEVVKDIQKQLKFREERLFQKSFARKNIAYIVRHTEDKIGQMFKILNAVSGTSIIYVRNRKKTGEIAELLKSEGISAEHYHAGLSNESKDRKQAAWKSGDCRVIVATNAFGMGIDKPDVRTVIHLDLPDTLEAYFQEAGRAGRDERKSYAVLLYNKSDSAKLKKRISDSYPEKKLIKKVYISLCNYYQVGEGSGLDKVYDFNLADFCSVFKYSIQQAYNSLKILQHAGYIELTEEVDNRSRVLFTVTKEELYRLHQLDGRLEELVKLLLRSYTGLFTEYAYIDEQLLSKRMDASRDEIYQWLLTLRKSKIIDYVPAKKTPFIVFTHERVDEKYLDITKAVYEDRKKRFEDRIHKVILYASEENRCRSRMLLHYFGEENSASCGCCDYCLSKNEKGVSNYEFTNIREKILSLLEKESTIPIFSLLSKLDTEKEEYVLDVLRWMQDQDEIFVDEKNCWQKKRKE